VRRRLDVELVRRGLTASCREAKDLVDAGRVRVGGAPALKLARVVGDPEPIQGGAPTRWFVSRGGEKLDAALSHFGIDVAGLRVIDIGASTGGFTDCLLQRGAAAVTALDVGHSQLHEKIRNDPRVHVIERLNVRHADMDALGAPFDLVVADLSFISLTLVAEPLIAAAGPGGQLVLLVKPQFEAGRADVSRGRGIITDPEIHVQACETVEATFRSHGVDICARMESPIHGSQGNTEFLFHGRVST
jgi:23S rRNA (cytidine1920-2'-O)/16S rRNA (cytidine1409-2'-O)-methyltransferase